MTRAFSRRSILIQLNHKFWFITFNSFVHVSISAPASLPIGPKWIRINLPKRDELSLRTVFALPKASNTGFVWTTWSSRLPPYVRMVNQTELNHSLIRTFFSFFSSPGFFAAAPTFAKYAITFFVFSVFPAPDSPLNCVVFN